MKYSLILIFLLYGSSFLAQPCCTFKITPTISALTPPTAEELDNCDLESKGCDLRYYYTARMLNTLKTGTLADFQQAFERLVPLIDAKPKDDSTSIQIIYVYAAYLEMFGESAKATALYRYILNHTKENTLHHTLAKISIAGASASTEEVDKNTDALLQKWNATPAARTDATATVILKNYNYLSSGKRNTFFNALQMPANIDKTLYFVILLNKLHSALDTGKPVTDEELQAAEARYSELSGEKIYVFWHLFLSMKANAEGDYLKSIALAKAALEHNLGAFDSTPALIELMKHTEKKAAATISRYAHSLLFQTRLGKGISVVQESFDIDEALFELQLSENLRRPNLMAGQRDIFSLSPINSLIIATYLFQLTGEVDYLNRSLSVMEGFTGSALNYWTAARRMMRQDPELANKIIEERAALEAMASPQKEATIGQVIASMQQVDSLRADLLERYPMLIEEVSEVNKIDLYALQRKLQQDSSAFLGFYSEANSLYRVYVDRDSIEVKSLFEDWKEIATLAKKLHQQSSINKEAAYSAVTARRLYQLLFKDLDGRLPGRLRIVAEGALASIPFAALRQDSSGAPRFLGVEYAISRQFSIGGMLMLENLALSSSAPYPLALAPAFKSNFLQASDLRQAGFYLAPLFYNTDEVKKLEAMGPGNYYYDERATLARYVDQVEDHSIVHLATHAISSQTDGLRSRIYLLDEAEAPASLYAADIGEQTLSADLVVLSACETGTGGQHRTEGTIGLHRAYLAAGARSVVASLWAIDDYATAELMDGFYSSLANNMPPDRALQAARKAYLERFPDASPYKWAAFSAYGGMKPVNWDRTPPSWPYLLYGGLALMGVVVVGLGLRKFSNAA